MGLAISDPLGFTAQPLPAVSGRHTETMLENLQQVIAQYGVETIVLGFPRNMNGTCGPRAEKTEALAALLRERFSVPVVLWDERLTTVSATRILNETNVRGQKRKNSIDSLSAVILLQNYLQKLSSRS